MKLTGLYHPNGMAEYAPDNAKIRIAHFNDTCTFYEVAYSNGTFIEMWSNNDWINRWAVPAGQDATDYFINTVFSMVHGITWEDSNQLLTKEELQD